MWVAIIGTIGFPVIGLIFNTLITNKINDIKKQQDEDKNLFFKRLDEEKLVVEHQYVRRDLYELTMKFHLESGDEKFKSLLSIVNTQFQNMETKLNVIHEKMQEKSKDIKDLEGKVDEVKKMITEKLNTKERL